MELAHMVVTVRAVATQGAVNVKGLDVAPAVQAYQDSLKKRLAKAGLDVRVPREGRADEGVTVISRVVRVDPGSRGMHFFLGRLLTALFGGYGVFEVEGQVGHGTAPLAELHAVGKDYNGRGARGVTLAAAYAGRRAAKQVVKALETR